jgi:methionine aminopeptidase type I
VPWHSRRQGRSKKGDIVNVDVTVIKDGWYGDTSRMFIVGEASIAAKRLMRHDLRGHVARHRAGAPRCTPGRHRLGYPEVRGEPWFSVVREFCGHGIGQVFHEEPQVLHYGKPGTGEELKPGMTFTIEPMINAGRREVRELGDGWTIVTKDHSLSAQWEHTVLVTPDRLRGADSLGRQSAAAGFRQGRRSAGLSLAHASPCKRPPKIFANTSASARRRCCRA